MISSKYNLEELQDISPFENYVTAIRDKATKKKYAGQLEMFLNPNYDWDLPQQKRKLLPEHEFAVLVNNFVNLIKNDPNAGKNKIKRYVMILKKQIMKRIGNDYSRANYSSFISESNISPKTSNLVNSEQLGLK